MNNQLRLNKYLAERLGVSRREADDLIASGKVLVNNKPAALGARIDKNDKILCNNKPVVFDNEFIYVAMNKPVGYVCSRRAQGDAPTLYDILPAKYQRLKTVGRLDKDSSGLILLTNDGDFTFQMTHPKFHKEKTYLVELDRDLAPLHQQMISDFGVDLDDGKSKFAVIRNEKYKDRKHFTVVLSEGRNRQIRRTFQAVGYRVVKLHRITFGKFNLGNLKSGATEEIPVNMI